MIHVFQSHMSERGDLGEKLSDRKGGDQESIFRQISMRGGRASKPGVEEAAGNIENREIIKGLEGKCTIRHVKHT